MSAPSLREAFQPGIGVMNSSVNPTTGTILISTGDAANQTSEAGNVGWWQHVGFLSRPSNPVAGKTSAECFTVRRGDRDIAICSRDIRGQTLAGSLKPGETCLYAPGSDGNGQARILLKADGSINLYARQGNTSSGPGMIIQIDAQNDAIRITNSKGYGIVIDSNGVKLFTGGSGAGLTLAAGGDVKLIASGKCLVDGGNICLGALATPATPVCGGPAGIAAIPSTKVFMSVA